jgi:hypothetical protein
MVRYFCFGLSLSLAILVTFAAAQTAQQRTATRTVPAETMSRLGQLHDSLQPSVRNWIDEQALNIAQRHSLDLSALRSSVQRRFPALNKAGSDGSVLALLEMILRQSILQTNADKQNYLQRMQDLNTVSQAISDQLNALAHATEEQPSQKGNQDSPQGNQGSQQKDYRCANAYCQSLSSRLANLNSISAKLPHPLHLQAPANPTYADLQNLKASLKGKLDTIGDDTQLANVDLQNTMQAQQQALQTLSDISKEFSDTAMSIIRNLN